MLLKTSEEADTDPSKLQDPLKLSVDQKNQGEIWPLESPLL